MRRRSFLRCLIGDEDLGTLELAALALALVVALIWLLLSTAPVAR